MTQETTVHQRLVQAGIPVGPASGTDSDSPWFVKVLQGISAWLASFFVLGFLALALSDVLEQPVSRAVVGLGLVAGAYGLVRRAANDFVTHLALALSLAGQLALAWVILEAYDALDEPPFWWGLALMQLVLTLLIPEFVHRVMTMGFAILAASTALLLHQLESLALGLSLLAAVFAWLNEYRRPARLRAVQAWGYGLVLGVLANAVVRQFQLDFNLWADGPSPLPVWLGDVATLPALAVLMWDVYRRRTDPARLPWVWAGAAALGVALVSLTVSGLLAGVILLALGFAVSHRWLMGTGVVLLVISISHYYYTLELTLLAKSAVLLVLGVALLALRFGLVRWWREADHV